MAATAFFSFSPAGRAWPARVRAPACRPTPTAQKKIRRRRAGLARIWSMTLV
ncbi:MAG TPA: hypothetical protein P5119_11070 [Candidatus Aminicenantes bacterium]|nr:hypothetical protein [Candidatus Aminicenantes bacterium]HRY65867.1 hypothetical protein [Candidatus Aminicenantes bacterium]HRZ72807.1 hypothetical protein [Candidatus Aminicenantes bacterium]